MFIASNFNRGAATIPPLPPVPTLTTPSGTVTGAFTVTVVFRDADGNNMGVVGFVVGDVTVSNGTLSAFTAVNTYTYTYLVTPVADGAVVTSLAAAVCTAISTGAANSASNVLTTVYAALPVNTVAPVTSGSQVVGGTLNVTTGSWTGSGITYTYKWQRDTVDISSATSSTYTVVDADDGHGVRGVVGATNAGGGPVYANGNSLSINDFVNSSMQIAVGVVANSTGSYASSGGPGVAPTAGTAYEWNGSSLVNLGTSLLNSGTGGSFKGDWTTNFSTLYYTATGRKPCFGDGHVYGSLLYATSGASWITTGFVRGSLYTAWKTKFDGLLSNIGLTKGIIYLGDILINDVGQVKTVADIDTAYRALITFIQADYPGSPIYIVGMATDAASGQSQRQLQIRINALNTPASYTGVHFFYHGMYIFSCNNMNSKHWNQSANDALGRSFNDFLVSTESDWDVRRITNQFYDQLNATQRGYVRTLILAAKSTGAWTGLNYLTTDVQTTRNNKMMDWIGVTSPRADIGLFTFNTKANIQTNGSTTFDETYFVPLWMMMNGTQDDVIIMTKVGVNSTPAGTVGTLFGVTASSSMSIWQLATSRLGWKCNDNTTSTHLLLTKFSDNTWYGVARDPANSGKKYLMEGSTKLANATVASAALAGTLIQRGARNSNPQDCLTATWTGGLWCAKYSAITDLATWLTAFDTFSTNMAAS